MQRYRPAYPPKFRRQMVDLVHSGRTPEELSEEFEPASQSVAKWVRQADRDAGKRVDGTTSARNYPSYVVKTAAWRHERDILAKHVPDTDPGAAARFARESKANPNGSGGS